MIKKEKFKNIVKCVLIRKGNGHSIAVVCANIVAPTVSLLNWLNLIVKKFSALNTYSSPHPVTIQEVHHLLSRVCQGFLDSSTEPWSARSLLYSTVPWPYHICFVHRQATPSPFLFPSASWQRHSTSFTEHKKSIFSHSSIITGAVMPDWIS
jgi:hypothetical protein